MLYNEILNREMNTYQTVFRWINISFRCLLFCCFVVVFLFAMKYSCERTEYACFRDTVTQEFSKNFDNFLP